jgi:hypothetical protein
MLYSRWCADGDVDVLFCAVTVVSGSRRLSPRHAEDTLRLPLVRPDPSATVSPVFVDSTGRRAHRLHRWRWIVVVPAAGYLVAVASSLFGEPSLPSALLLTDEPSQGSASHDNSGTSTADDLALAPETEREVQTSPEILSGPASDAAPDRMTPRGSDGEVSRSQPKASVPSMERGNSAKTHAANRGKAHRRPPWAGQPSAGAGRAKGDPPGRHVGHGQREVRPSAGPAAG